MLKHLTLGLIPLFMVSGATAIEAKYKIDQIPVLNPEPQHKVSSTRTTGLFTRTHFK